MNPTDLINPRCKLTGTVPVIRSTRHLFLDLPKLTTKLQNYIDSTSQLGGWTANCMQVPTLATSLRHTGLLLAVAAGRHYVHDGLSGVSSHRRCRSLSDALQASVTACLCSFPSCWWPCHSFGG